MAYLFSKSGHQRLFEIVKPGVLCVFDFDGTLAPIVKEPEHAHLRRGFAQRLVDLRAYAPVAIITGRSVDDVRARLGFEPEFLIGNHGLEGVPGWSSRSEDYAALCQRWRSELDSLLREAGVDPKIWIEDKRYSLALHYRNAQHRAQAEKQLAALIAHLAPPPRVVAGKCVFNLVPPDAPDKGTALLHLMRATGAATAIYLGDDVTDEDVFRLARPEILSIRVEPSAHSAAEFCLHNRSDVATLLDTLVTRLRQLKSEATPLAEPAHAA
jgi:trehalose 6-phosphate phosphatase